MGRVGFGLGGRRKNVICDFFSFLFKIFFHFSHLLTLTSIPVYKYTSIQVYQYELID